MELPNMACVVSSWSTPYEIRTITKVTVDFADANTTATRTQQLMIQPAQKRRLNPDLVDWSLRYVQIHTTEQLVIGEELTFNGIDFRVIDDGDWQLYGYTDAVAEEIKPGM
tara:strand:- start:1485 stop:1817 length:333 start_codon:yes stop_codon:yes gene_type:complete